MKKKQLKKLIKSISSEQKLLNKNISKLDIFLQKYINKEVEVSDFQHSMLREQHSMLREQQLSMLHYDAILRQRLEDSKAQVDNAKEVKEWLS